MRYWKGLITKGVLSVFGGEQGLPLERGASHRMSVNIRLHATAKALRALCMWIAALFKAAQPQLV